MGGEEGGSAGVQVRRTQLASYLAIFVAAPLATFTAGRRVDAALGLTPFPPFPWSLILGLGVFLFGLWLGIHSTRLLYGLGEGLPWGEARREAMTRRLVTTGVYGLTRNPMVIGYSLLPFGMGIMFQSPGMALSMGPLVLAANIGIVKLREEPGLEARFGAEYVAYRKRTPFLIPRLGSVMRFMGLHLDGRGAQLLHLALSLGGLSLLALLYARGGGPRISIPSQAQVTGALFMAVCLVGLVAAVSPGTLRGVGHGSSAPRSAGHHPSCGRFSGHVIRFRGRPLCAGCTGLALGAILSVAGSVPIFFLGLRLPSHDVFFWLGAVAVALGLAQHLIDLGSPYVHVLLNVSLVCGSFMLASSLSAAGVSFFVEAYHLALAVFWVAARIRVSQEEHALVCRACGLNCEQSHYPPK